MINKNKNNLIVIENGQLTVYDLNDKNSWTLGRVSKENIPDIRLKNDTISRKHGRFQNMDGIWFYIDNYGKNGTVCNDRFIEKGFGGRVKPILLNDGDKFVFGGGKETVINCKTVWAMYTQKDIDGLWNVEDTRGFNRIVFTDAKKTVVRDNPPRGTVEETDEGMAIYMGNLTYVFGNIIVVGK